MSPVRGVIVAVPKKLTVAVYFSVEIEAEAAGEPEAILRAGPAIHALEEKLVELGYNVQMEQVRVRRPRTSAKASEREAAKRKNGRGD
jgi:hypothetical protein